MAECCCCCPCCHCCAIIRFFFYFALFLALLYSSVVILTILYFCCLHHYLCCRDICDEQCDTCFEYGHRNFMLPYRRNVARRNVEIVPVEPEQYIMVRNPNESLSVGKLILSV
jgi:hypothetical protein